MNESTLLIGTQSVMLLEVINRNPKEPSAQSKIIGDRSIALEAGIGSSPVNVIESILLLFDVECTALVVVQDNFPTLHLLTRRGLVTENVPKWARFDDRRFALDRHIAGHRAQHSTAVTVTSDPDPRERVPFFNRMGGKQSRHGLREIAREKANVELAGPHDMPGIFDSSSAGEGSVAWKEFYECVLNSAVLEGFSDNGVQDALSFNSPPLEYGDVSLINEHVGVVYSTCPQYLPISLMPYPQRLEKSDGQFSLNVQRDFTVPKTTDRANHLYQQEHEAHPFTEDGQSNYKAHNHQR
ncbi:hypothetical protein EV421DRAFT_1743381 [Armillaria borealis]|uniref:Uncharacterized protein n=1 Tax=Armillaria borealis TaxID=47425 RepID=A0AA39MDT0_9AGAR|nr:hypothetical protein EV421DRAFT_1743381 [Armillaria borealis]